MIWVLYALFAAFAGATVSLMQKFSLKEFDENIVAWAVWFFSLPIIIVTLYIVKIPKLDIFSLFLFLIAAILEVIAIILNVKAIKISGLSNTIPLLTFTPVFLTIISWLFLNEIPSIIGIAGIMLIVLGSYTIKTIGKSLISLEPLKNLFKDRGSLYMLITAFLYALVTLIYKVLINKYKNPLAISGVVILFISVIATIYLIFISRKNPFKVVKKNPWLLLLMGFLSALGSLASFKAQSLTLNAYMISIKRLSIIFSVIYGYTFFKESGVIKNIIAALLMVVGATLIAVG